MDIKRIIHNFNIRNNQGFQQSNLSVPCEVLFPSRSLKQQVCFSNINNEGCFDLINYKRDESRQFKLMESNVISKECLNKMSTEFSFDIINHPLVNELLMGVIPNISKEYGRTCYGAIKKIENQYFFTIFSKKGNTNFEDNMIYVYGILEVNLPKKMESDLFNHIHPTDKPV